MQHEKLFTRRQAFVATRASLFLCLLLIGALFAGFRGEKIADFTLPNLDNEHVQLSKMLKRGPVLLDFWATWCRPCIKSFPDLQQLHQKYQKMGLQVIGVNEDGNIDRRKVQRFVDRLKINFPILIDSKNSLMAKMQVRVLPTTLLIAPDGTVVMRHVGYSSNSFKKLDKEINTLLRKK